MYVQLYLNKLKKKEKENRYLSDRAEEITQNVTLRNK